MDFTLSTITKCLHICMTIVYWQNLISLYNIIYPYIISLYNNLILITHAKYFCVIMSQDNYISSLRFITTPTNFMAKLLCKLSCIVINLEYLVIIYTINCIPYHHKNRQLPLYVCMCFFQDYIDSFNSYNQINSLHTFIQDYKS